MEAPNKLLSTFRYKWAHYYIENSLIMNYIIKQFW
jgi:hypothetical protein